MATSTAAAPALAFLTLRSPTPSSSPNPPNHFLSFAHSTHFPSHIKPKPPTSTPSSRTSAPKKTSSLTHQHPQKDSPHHLLSTMPRGNGGRNRRCL
ncbi:hypothetical protein CRYUN_Cryun37aG0106300 [Craigia yunnanensis]